MADPTRMTSRGAEFRRRQRNWAMLVVLLALSRAVLRHHHREDDASGMNGHSAAATGSSPGIFAAVARRHGGHVVRRRSRSTACSARRPAMAARRRSARPRRRAATAARSACASMPTPIPACPGPSRPIRSRSACRWARSTSRSTPRATRRASPVTGVALYNVTPEKVAKYFHKTACFCFNQQTLEAGQTMEFPLSFWVDPAIAKDPEHGGRPDDHAVLHVLPLAGRCGEVRRAGQGRSACRAADARRPLERASEFAMMRQPFRENMGLA